jgi:hypothetical protein
LETLVVVEVHSKNKELDAGDDEGAGAHDGVVVVVDVVVVDDEGVVVALSDTLEESRWKQEKDAEIPSWFVPGKSTWVVEERMFFVS